MLAVNLLDFPSSVPRLLHYSGGLPILDTRLHYGESEVYRLLDALGPEGRASYLRFYWTLDLFMPVLFGTVLWLGISRGSLSRWAWAGIVAAGLDYAENIVAALLLIRYPQHQPMLAQLGGTITAVKWTAYTSAVLLVIAGRIRKA